MAKSTHVDLLQVDDHPHTLTCRHVNRSKLRPCPSWVLNFGSMITSSHLIQLPALSRLEHELNMQWVHTET
jgi:hypothetical protein